MRSISGSTGSGSTSVEALITTSWDDGAIDDLRLAELLAKYEVPACFYVPRSNLERPVIEAPAIRQLGARFEIGGHTLRHLCLTELGSQESWEEIHGCKAWLEDLLGRPIVSFCYPGGRFSSDHVRQVSRAGFKGARLAEWFGVDPVHDPYRIRPTLHVYPHRAWRLVMNGMGPGSRGALATYLRKVWPSARPSEMAAALLELIVAKGGTFHLWGHSWELTALGLWDELETILKAINQAREHLIAVDNAAVVRRTSDARDGSHG